MQTLIWTLTQKHSFIIELMKYKTKLETKHTGRNEGDADNIYTRGNQDKEE